MEKFTPTEYYRPLFEELKAIGCVFDSNIQGYEIPENKRPAFSEIKNFYFGESKTLTPFQKKLKTYLEENLPADILVKKTDKGMWVLDENDLMPKDQLNSLLDKIGGKIVRTMGGRRYLLNTEGAFGKLK